MKGDARRARRVGVPDRLRFVLLSTHRRGVASTAGGLAWASIGSRAPLGDLLPDYSIVMPSVSGRTPYPLGGAYCFSIRLSLILSVSVDASGVGSVASGSVLQLHDSFRLAETCVRSFAG